MSDTYTTGLTEDVLNHLRDLQTFPVRSYLVAENIDIQVYGFKSRNHAIPQFISLSETALAAVFRYGAVVMMNAPSDVEAAFLDSLSTALVNPYTDIETEILNVSVKPGVPESIRQDDLNILSITAASLEIIADMMAKTVKLDKHELLIADRFSKSKPIASLIAQGNIKHHDKALLNHMGMNLLTEHELVARVQLTERPAVLWENSNLDQLYNVLLEEFEITERKAILEQKMEVISRTAQTYLDVTRHQHGSRLEWYIIFLIGVEIALEVYGIMAPGGH